MTTTNKPEVLGGSVTTVFTWMFPGIWKSMVSNPHILGPVVPLPRAGGPSPPEWRLTFSVGILINLHVPLLPTYNTLIFSVSSDPGGSCRHQPKKTEKYPYDVHCRNVLFDPPKISTVIRYGPPKHLLWVDSCLAIPTYNQVGFLLGLYLIHNLVRAQPVFHPSKTMTPDKSFQRSSCKTSTWPHMSCH